MVEVVESVVNDLELGTLDCSFVLTGKWDGMSVIDGRSKKLDCLLVLVVDN